jgi:Amt family ammonium transporter
MMSRLARVATILAVLTSTSGRGWAEEPATGTAAKPEFNQADIAWMLVSSALVLLMTGPGLALFYGGLVRRKNVLSVMMQCLFLMGMNSVLWFVIAYSLAFSTNGPTLFTTASGQKITAIGGLDKLLLNGVGPTGSGDYTATGTIPEELFMVFQMMFFIITPALIAGAFAERMKFSAMVLFTLLWGLLVYCPLAHWVWSGDAALFGKNSPLASYDFAGGLVVHASSGVSALICALVLGKRIGHGQEPMPPHNMTYTVIGACLLWVGWFGFNAGSQLAADARAVNAFVVTHLCAAAGLLGWACTEWWVHGKPSVLGACSGVVAGLVVITPASGFVTPGAAIIMGIIGGGICYLACAKVKAHFGYDDALDAFGVHGVGGSLGAILTGVFATTAVTGEAALPANLLRNQFIGLLITYALAVVGTWVILKIVDAAVGLRVAHAVEVRGLDVSEHSEEGYIF